MATANDVITAAGRRIGVLAGEEVFTAADMADALGRLNDMMHAFNVNGIHYAHTTLALTDTVNVPDELIDSLKWLMADTLVNDYEVTLTPRQAVQIADSKNNLQGYYWIQPPADTEPYLRPLRGRFDITRFD